MAHEIVLDGMHLSLEEVESVARGDAKITLGEDAFRRVERSSRMVKELSKSDVPVYGVNTGFGVFAVERIDPAQSASVSHNLLLSHSAGVGPPYPEDVVRAAILIRANTLARGHSGVRPAVVQTLLKMLEGHVTPCIPSKGSVGSSGDLAPLAHLSIVLAEDPNPGRASSSGFAWQGGELLSGEQAMSRAGIPRIQLGPKEGLALTNGATFSAALLALACCDAERALKAAEIAAAMSLEALLGSSKAFDERLHAARPHPGQIAVASRIRSLTKGSNLLDTSGLVQDAYSLRCIPQIIGPAWEILEFVKGIAFREINSATDNPLLFDSEAIAGGNFHGEAIGLAADYLKVALAEVGALSERRLYRLVSEHTNLGLPAMLVRHKKDAGLNSGLMMLQYSAASLVLENQSLATPNSLHSLPTSAGLEDLNANSTTAARTLNALLENLFWIVAMEFIAATQGLDLRLESLDGASMGRGTRAAHNLVREAVPLRDEDHPLAGDIETIAGLAKGSRIIQAVEQALH